MAEEAFEAYHVPQQSRRDKLRVGGCFVDSDSNLTHHQHHHQQQQHNSNNHNLQALIHPLYDPSLLSSDLVKVEGINLMGFGSSSSSYLDPQSSLSILNPTSVHDMNAAAGGGGSDSNNININNNNPFLYHFRDFDSSEVVVFKPEPIPLAHHDSNNNATVAGSVTGHGLSLSLSSSQSHHNNNSPLELNLHRYGGGCVVPPVVGGGGSGSTSNDVSRISVVPLGPFTGYASILKGSRFLKPAQQLLEEFCDVGRGIYAEKFAADSSLLDHPPLDSFGGGEGGGEDPRSSGDGGENRRKKSRLISMLDEVYRRYKQYYQQIQAVVASFEYVAGLGNAAPFANLALKTMSKHFKCLKNAIIDQLQFSMKGQGQMGRGKDEAARFENENRGFYSQRSVNNPGYLENQSVWRPQRGLPERAVTVLRAWLFEHFLHPYPTDTDKIMLAKQTGLTRSQVSNWFINARVRLWKPMVEEIHMLETRQGHKGLQREEQNGNRPSNHLSSANSNTSQKPSSIQRIQDNPSKRSRSELPDMPATRNEEPMNLPYNNLSSNPQVSVGGSSVSLTLGLHQNNGIGLSEPFPMNAAQRFGLAMEGNNSEGYVMGGFEAQHGLLHDFVG